MPFLIHLPLETITLQNHQKKVLQTESNPREKLTVYHLRKGSLFIFSALSNHHFFRSAMLNAFRAFDCNYLPKISFFIKFIHFSSSRLIKYLKCYYLIKIIILIAISLLPLRLKQVLKLN